MVLYVILGFFAFLLVAGTVLRIRKLARDKRMRESIGVDPRHAYRIPAPAEPSRSFRKLEANEGPTQYSIERPRIDPVKRQFFDDGEDRYEQYPQPVSRGRHDNDWLLDRSRHRSNATKLLAWLLIAIAVAIAGSGVVYYVITHHSASH